VFDSDELGLDPEEDDELCPCCGEEIDDCLCDYGGCCEDEEEA
jgi:hypothetical protein